MSFDLILELIEIAVHVVLKERKLYPASIFEDRFKYGVIVPISTHPWIASYISETLKDVKTAWSSEEPTGECSLDLVLLKDEKVSEKIRFRFDSRWGTLSKREIGEDVYYQGIEREFRGIVRKITQVLSKSEDENRAFHETNSENSFIFHFYSNDEKYLSHWITVQESISLFQGKPTILPIRKIFTPFKLEVASEIMC
ncbi:mitotic spindle assembly checkpoint protein MAD2B [Lepeophtheirus salmonis]|uniref:mitotic spindle assembly checkpoint protein MAD2B n=1 Tax=Lepeophtheirus salmonis TaxID=72036 RepID=UPI001AEAF521|nr:mitotic spindle assembly checkpoint protein MAD2B-like [Lepeophtheirus salmonis]